MRRFLAEFGAALVILVVLVGVPANGQSVEPSTSPTGERYCWKDSVTSLQICKDSNGTTLVHTWIEVSDISAKLDLIIALLKEKQAEYIKVDLSAQEKAHSQVAAGTMAIYDGQKWRVIR